MIKHLASLISIVLLLFVCQVSFGRTYDEEKYEPGMVKELFQEMDIPSGSYMKVYFEVRYMGPNVVGSSDFTPDYARILFPDGTTIAFREAPEMQFINEVISAVDGLRLVSNNTTFSQDIHLGSRLIMDYLFVKE